MIITSNAFVKTISIFIMTISPLCLIMFLSNCGKSAVMGTVGGGTIGALAAGKRDRGLGALIGAGVGGLIGNAMDESDKKEKEAIHRKVAVRQAQINDLECENRTLRKSMAMYCPKCECKEKALGARSCSQCGSRLIKQKFCPQCSHVQPLSAKFCPLCPNRVPLQGW